MQIENLLSDRRIELASPEIVDHYVKDMRRVLEESELTEKRAFLRGFVKRIDVTDGEGIMTYVMPINGVMKERIGVPPIVHDGGRYCTIGRTFELAFMLSERGERILLG